MASLHITTGEKYFVKPLGLLFLVTNSNEICKHASKKSHSLAKYATNLFQLTRSPKCISKHILERSHILVKRVALAFQPIREFN